MTQDQFNYTQQTPYNQQAVPNSTEVLVLGILTIVLCWCYGIVSVILGTITLFLASDGIKKYKANPQIYSEGSYRNLIAGRTCAIVGLSLAVFSLLFALIYLLLFGSMMFNMFDHRWF